MREKTSHFEMILNWLHLFFILVTFFLLRMFDLLLLIHEFYKEKLNDHKNDDKKK